MCTGLEGLALAQGASALAGGYAQQQAGRAQADLMQGQAAAERDVAKAEAEKIRRVTRNTQGAARAALAGAGVDVSRGTPLTIDEDIARRGAEDEYMMLLTGERRARDLQFAGRQARRAGNSALAQSVVGAVGNYAMARWRGGSSQRQVNNYSPFLEGEDAFAGR